MPVITINNTLAANIDKVLTGPEGIIGATGLHDCRTVLTTVQSLVKAAEREEVERGRTHSEGDGCEPAHREFRFNQLPDDYHFVCSCNGNGPADWAHHIAEKCHPKPCFHTNEPLDDPRTRLDPDLTDVDLAADIERDNQ
jgi:hypothetical protein